MDNRIFLIGLFVGYVVFNLIPYLAFRFWERKIDRDEFEETNSIKENEINSIKEIKVERKK